MLRGLGWIGVAAVFFGSLSAFGECSYRPFDFKIAVGSPAKNAANAGLPVAQAFAENGASIWSEPPFLLVPTKRGNLVWGLNAGHDTNAASDNTMLELLGYFREFLGLSGIDANQFLSTNVMSQFQGISSSDLGVYPGGYNKAKVEAAVRASFPGNGDQVLSWMKSRNLEAKWNGLVHFSRPSYLDTNSLDKTVVLACMTVAYARDMYNPALSTPEREDRRHIAKQVLRASLVDLMASAALKAQREGKNPEQTVRLDLVKDQIQCRLIPATNLVLQPLPERASDRCTSVSQPAPVVRKGPETARDQRLVQVGANLFTVRCYLDKGRDWLDPANWTAKNAKSLDHFISLMANDPALAKSPIGSSVRTHLNHLIRPDLSAESQRFVSETTEKCNGVLKDQLKRRAERIATAPRPTTPATKGDDFEPTPANNNTTH